MTGAPLSYYTTSPLEQYFVDKDTGLPLAYGIVTFYKDSSRTTLKPVYELTGTPPNYTFVPLENPLILSAVGTFIDESGNDITPFYFPYTDPTIQSPTSDPYYITVYSSVEGEPGTPAVLQFTREAWPYPVESIAPSEGENIINYIPNGQFITHNNIPAVPQNTTSPSIPSGTISKSNTIIAPGGWTFDRPTTSISTQDSVVFINTGPDVDPVISSHPRYYAQINADFTTGDSYKDLRIKFPNVGRFSSASQMYTFFFSAINNNSGPLTLQFYLNPFFGTGQPVVPPTFIGNLIIQDSWSVISSSFIFPLHPGLFINPMTNDDYIQLVVRIPMTVGIAANISFTDFGLTLGNVGVQVFPETTNEDSISRAVSGWIGSSAPNANPPPIGNPYYGPDFNGNDLYLPLIQTPYGLTFSHNEIGNINAAFRNSPNTGELLCDGSQYQNSSYSLDGIPYSRLGNSLFNDSLNIPIFGTGFYYSTAYISQLISIPSNQIRLSNNQPGSTSATIDGSTPTGFVFYQETSNLSGQQTYDISSYQNGPQNIICFSKSYNLAALAEAPNAHSTGFIVRDIRNLSSENYHIFSININNILPSTLSGDYFTFQGINTDTKYAFWFTVDGSGVAPSAPGYTLVQVNLKSTYTSNEISSVISDALNNFQVSTIIINKTGSTITDGSYWIFSTNSNTTPPSHPAIPYYVWYSTTTSTVDPMVSGAIGIKVNIASIDTSANIAIKTQIAINKMYYAVPNLQGLFLRGNDPSGLWDIDNASRYGLVDNIYGSSIAGTIEIDQFLSHDHLYANTLPTSGAFTTATGSSAPTFSPTTFSGGQETRPANLSVNWFIKY